MKYFLKILFVLQIGFVYSQSISPGQNPCHAIDLSVQNSIAYAEYSNAGTFSSDIPLLNCTRHYQGKDLWFSCIVPSSGLLKISTQAGSITSAGLAVYSGDECIEISQIICETDYISMPFIKLNENHHQAGKRVWIRFWPLGQVIEGTFGLCVSESEAEVKDVMALTVTTNLTPQQLVQNYLITGCLQAYNVTFTGDLQGIGYFTNANPPLGFNSGVILASGPVTNAVGPNNSGSISGTLSGPESDPQLAASISTSASNIYDATVLEFDFIPSSDTISFQYVFGSDEYPEFANSNYNDVFGFFITSLDADGYNYVNKNIALLPGTNTPVSINNVNHVNNTQYYINNDNNANIQYDGLTVTLTAWALVQACSHYHIKLAIADCYDSSFDSGVFLREGSFSSGVSVTMQNHSMLGSDHDLYEGCMNYYVFARADTTSLIDTVQVDLIITGTAASGTDYSPLPTTINILPGQIYDTLYYYGLFDNLDEGVETIIFSVANGCQCNQSLVSDTIFLYDNFTLNGHIDDDATICMGDSITLHAQVHPGFADNPTMISYLWNTGDTTANIVVSPNATTTYSVSVNDPCLQDTVMSMIITVVPAINPQFHANKDSACFNEHVIVTFDGFSGPAATYVWNFSGATIVSGSDSGPYELFWGSEGDKIISLQISDIACVHSWNETVHVNPIPQAAVIFTNVICNEACDGTATVVPGVTTSHLPLSCIWSDPAFQTTITATGLCPGMYNVTFTNTGGCSSSSTVNISEPSAMLGYLQGTNILCYNGSNGAIDLTVGNGTPTYTFLWSNGATTEDLSSLPAGFYSVTVTDANDCFIIDSITLTQPSQGISCVFDPYDISCFGGGDGKAVTHVTGGTYPYSYQWNDINGQTTPTAFNLSAGSYSVIITDINNCTVSSTVTIQEPPLITLSASSTPASCHGMIDGFASVTISGGVPAYTFAWSNGCTQAQNENIAAGVYHVTIVDQNLCIVSASAIVTQPEAIHLVPGSDQWICKGDSADISGQALGGTYPYTYFWQGADGTAQTGQSINVSPLVTTVYQVSATDNFGCTSGIHSVTVFVYPDLFLDVYTIKDTVCKGEAAVIRATIMGGDGGPYELLCNGVMVAPPFDVFPENSQMYVVTLSDRCGTQSVSDSVMIYVLPEPPNNPVLDNFTGCVPHTISFSEQSLNEGQRYQWNFGDGGYSEAKNPVYTYTNPGNYYVQLTVTSILGCRKTIAFLTPVEAYPLPDARFYPQPDVTTEIRPEFQFFNISDNYVSSYWIFGDGDSSIYTGNPIHTFPGKGVYNVALVVISNHGCLDTLIVPVNIIDEFSLYVPTAFSPDGDGSNEFFKPYGSGIAETNYYFIVFDRWGMKVFETKDYNQTWDGKTSGEKAKTGIYTWVLFYKDLIGNGKTSAGTVTLLR